jgi:predicted Zn-dependent protease
MHSVGEAIKTLNLLRRDAILDPSRGATEWSLREWQGFRTQVADWIRRLPLGGTERTEEQDWTRLWRLFNPDTTPIRSIRNRTRMWTDCERPSTTTLACAIKKEWVPSRKLCAR